MEIKIKLENEVGIVLLGTLDIRSENFYKSSRIHTQNISSYCQVSLNLSSCFQEEIKIDKFTDEP